MNSIRVKYFLLSLYILALLGQSCKTDETCPLINCNEGIQNQSTCSCDCNEGYLGDNCETFDPTKVQYLLDSENRTPIELANAGIPLDSLYGKIYQGGLIFYLNTIRGIGMVAAREDQTDDVIWGCYEILIDGTGDDIEDGSTNTDAIISVCQEDLIAAALCRALGDDWFLPSKDELNFMWTNLADSDGDGINTGTSDPNNLGGFATEFYWSSTEHNDKIVWIQNFGSGKGVQNFKFKEYAVRAAKAF